MALALAHHGRARLTAQLLPLVNMETGRVCACSTTMGTGTIRSTRSFATDHRPRRRPLSSRAARLRERRPLDADAVSGKRSSLSTFTPAAAAAHTPAAAAASSLAGQRASRTTRAMAPAMQRVDSRNTSTALDVHDVYEAVVVGAGPGGITAVGNLLANHVERILWVDDAFNGGRVNKQYREVPSNTKVKLFIDFATALAPFRRVASGLPSRDRWEEPSTSDGVPVQGSADKLEGLRRLEQEKGCDLSHAADMCLMLTQGLQKIPGVTTQRGRVSEAVLDQQSSTWNVLVDTDSSTQQVITHVQTRRLVLCTGSSPIDPLLPYEPAGLEHLPLDTALSPTKLAQILSPRGPTTIAVIGASHSAVLVLRNLSNLALSRKPDLQIQWFTRHPLRYAEYEDGFIARDNTGLKGEAAQWARDNLEPHSLPTSPVAACITKIAYEKGAEEEVYRQHLPGTALVVQAIGYARDPLPTLTLKESGLAIEPVFDHRRGVFHHSVHDGEGLARLPGLYGAGIAFPEQVVDKKYGHTEMNVGFFKFMKAVKNWVPEWKPVGV